MNAEVDAKRHLGTYTHDLDGPTLICLGGIHGNEPAALAALECVLDRLNGRRPAIRGSFIALAGNLTALGRGTRFIDEDLNRVWKPERITRLFSGWDAPGEPPTEFFDQQKLFAVFREHLHRNSQTLYILDLHTTSAPSAPFAIMSDTLRNRQFARKFRVPIILGLEEQVEGTILDFMGDQGACAVAFEAGQHQAESSQANHEAAIWVALAACGCIRREDIPNLDRHRQTLRAAAESLRPYYEVRYRYAIRPGEQFAMAPGFRNFQRVDRGRVLAESGRNIIQSTIPGFMFMPLYQSQGDDGYFIIRPVHPFWLKLSAFLRRKRLERLVPYLPGIRRDPRHPHQFIVNRRIARWLVVQLFHLLGYRKKWMSGERLVVVKRKYDVYDEGMDD